MIVKRFLAVLFVAMFFNSCPAWAAKGAEAPALQTQAVVDPAGTGSAYIVGPGDLLDISVWKDEALTKTVIVLPDGKISFPLIGEVTAGGKTVAQLKQEIEKKLSRYVPDMVLSVEVKQCNSMLVYVIGRVNNPGRFVLNSNINVLQGLAMAGGLNPFAKKDSIKIFRTEGGKTAIFPFRYSEVADGNHLEENIWLKQGDLILVP
jgi:polysaccharide export outer membrane protein